MKNLWGDIQGKQKLLVPNTIIKEQGNILREMTEELVEVEIIEIKNKRLKNAEFTFNVILTSYRMENYEYPMFRIEYDINIYPVRVILDININDINLYDCSENIVGNNEDNEMVLEAKDKEDFIELLGKILSSDKITNIVRSIKSLAEQIGKESNDLPF